MYGGGDEGWLGAAICIPRQYLHAHYCQYEPDESGPAPCRDSSPRLMNRTGGGVLPHAFPPPHSSPSSSVPGRRSPALLAGGRADQPCYHFTTLCVHRSDRCRLAAWSIPSCGGPVLHILRLCIYIHAILQEK